MYPKVSMSFSIIIIGGGIGGLAASILLAKSGHRVTVLERKDASFESRSTGGVVLFHNSVHILEAMGLENDLAQIADTGHQTHTLKYSTGEVIRTIQKKHPHSFVHRADLLRILHENAVEAGVDVRNGVYIASIHDSSDQPKVSLEDRTELQADLIVGADGIDSPTRHMFMPEISPRLTRTAVFLLSIPRSVMESHPGTCDLYQWPAFQNTLGPGRSIVSWTMSRRQVYHLQLCDYEYGDGSKYSLEDPPSSSYITTMTDTSGLLNAWSDFEPRIQHILNSTESYIKWKIGELPTLTTYASPSSRLVLLGDAAHAIQVSHPFAGQGANMAIEDGAALSTLLSLASSKKEIADAVKVYDQVRIPRLAGIREIIEANVRTFGMKDGEEQKRRDEMLAIASREKAKTEQATNVAAGVKREYGTAERYKWVEEYDAFDEARMAWQELKTSERRGIPIERQTF